MREMKQATLDEALAEAKAMADKCLGRYKDFSEEAWWQGREGDAEWKMCYTEDWPRRYMKASLNGRMYPQVHIWGGSGTKLVVMYDSKKERWTMIPAYLMGDECLLDAARKARDEWNREEKP